ncbi:MAG: hypothetical protein ACOYK7_11930 [Pirellulales bacterium]|jgi:hypothetical protein
MPTTPGTPTDPCGSHHRWAILAAGLVLGAGGLAVAQKPGRAVPATAEPSAGNGLWISTSQLDDGRQVLVIVDPGVRTAAVYHVEAATGALALKSTRNLTWDLLVGEFNTGEPRPSAVRRMVEQDPAGR